MGNRKQNLKMKNEKLVEIFLQNNFSDKELSGITGISASTVGRRLINKNMIIDVFNDEKNKLEYTNNSNDSYGEFIYRLVKNRRKENSYKGRSKGGQKAMTKNGYVKNNKGKYVMFKDFNLDKIFKDDNSKYKFLCLCCLTFRVKPSNVFKIVNIDVDLLCKNIKLYNKSFSRSLDYLEMFDKTAQNTALINFRNFYCKLVDAIKDGNKIMVHDLMNYLNDSDFNNIKDVDDSNFDIIINYQIKYAYSIDDMSQILNIKGNDYANLIKKYLQEHKSWQDKYYNLLKFLAVSLEGD